MREYPVSFLEKYNYNKSNIMSDILFPENIFFGKIKKKLN